MYYKYDTRGYCVQVLTAQINSLIGKNIGGLFNSMYQQLVLEIQNNG